MWFLEIISIPFPIITELKLIDVLSVPLNLSHVPDHCSHNGNLDITTFYILQDFRIFIPLSQSFNNRGYFAVLDMWIVLHPKMLFNCCGSI